MNIKNRILICLGGALLLFSSCGDFLKEYSQDLTYASNCDDLDEIMIGNGYLQRNTGAEKSDNSYYRYLHLLDDDMQEYASKMEAFDQDAIYKYQNLFKWDKNPFTNRAGVAFDNNDWDKLYTHIAYMNVINAYVDKFEDDPETQRQRLKGECKFLRASYYFMLVNLYANPYNKATAATELGVPLKLTEKVEARFFKRNTVEEVYTQIVKDLREAIDHLEGITQPSIYRVNQKAAHIMLSRVYLHMNEWELALAECEKIPSYMLELFDLNKYTYGTYDWDINATRVFFNTNSSPEVVFTMGVCDVASLLKAGSSGDAAVRTYGASEDLLNMYSAFEEDGKTDLRRHGFFFNTRTKAVDIVVPGKSLMTGFHSSANVFDNFIIRNSEVYLNKAEALAMLDRDAEAIAVLEEFWPFRFKDSNLPDISDLSGEALVKFIRDERRRELCFECHRWFDLRRYAVSDKYPEKRTITHVTLGATGGLEGIWTLKPYGEDPAWVLPLPEREIIFNEGALVDNPQREDRVNELIED